jgi:hypothetical protein
MFYFDSLTCIAKRYILCDFTFYSISPVGNLEMLIHLIISGVNRISRIMSFLKFEVLDFLDVEYTDSSFVPQHSLVILSKSRSLAFFNVSLNPLYFIVCELFFLNVL